jgi:hypothetical protein
MDTRSGLVELNLNETVGVATPSAPRFWFSFTYYAPPALLAGREARMR